MVPSNTSSSSYYCFYGSRDETNIDKYNMHYYTIDLSLATKLRDWRVSEDGLINDNSSSKRIRITKNNDKLKTFILKYIYLY